MKAGGVSVIPMTASSAAVVRGNPWKKQHTLDVSAWQAGEGERAHICERGYRATELC